MLAGQPNPTPTKIHKKTNPTLQKEVVCFFIHVYFLFVLLMIFCYIPQSHTFSLQWWRSNFQSSLLFFGRNLSLKLWASDFGALIYPWEKKMLVALLYSFAYPPKLPPLYLNEIFSVWPAEIIIMLLNHCMPTPGSRWWRWEAFDFDKETIFRIFSCVIENAPESIFQLFSHFFSILKYIYNKEIRILDQKILINDQWWRQWLAIGDGMLVGMVVGLLRVS